jgi:ribonuclease HIII
MNIEEMDKLLKAYGYIRVDTSNNPYLTSWKYEDGGRRINYYSSGTLMFQTKDNGNNPLVIRDATFNDLEDAIIQ